MVDARPAGAEHRKSRGLARASNQGRWRRLLGPKRSLTSNASPMVESAAASPTFANAADSLLRWVTSRHRNDHWRAPRKLTDADVLSLRVTRGFRMIQDFLWQIFCIDCRRVPIRLPAQKDTFSHNKLRGDPKEQAAMSTSRLEKDDSGPATTLSTADGDDAS